MPELRAKVQQEYSNNPLLRRLHGSGSGTSLTSARSTGTGVELSGHGQAHGQALGQAIEDAGKGGALGRALGLVQHVQHVGLEAADSFHLSVEEIGALTTTQLRRAPSLQHQLLQHQQQEQDPLALDCAPAQRRRSELAEPASTPVDVAMEDATSARSRVDAPAVAEDSLSLLEQHVHDDDNDQHAGQIGDHHHSYNSGGEPYVQNPLSAHPADGARSAMFLVLVLQWFWSRCPSP